MPTIKHYNNLEEFKVQVVPAQLQADLLVWVTKNKAEARDKDEIWCFVKDSPSRKVRFVNHSPDLKVFYVKNRRLARWRHGHRLQGRIGRQYSGSLTA